MKILFVVIISISIHLFLYFTIQKDNNNIHKKLTKHKSTNENITFIKIKPNKAKKNLKIKKRKFKPKIKPKIKYKLKPKIKPKPNPKILKKKILKKEKKTIIEKEVIKKPKIVKKQIPIDEVTKEYLKLYGTDFKKYPKETQVYLIKNIKDIASITKAFLQYPYISIQAEQSGVSVVQFILYPNGTISDLKIIKSSKYFLLDDNTKETINDAYSDYPRPHKPTIIRIFVKYILN